MFVCLVSILLNTLLPSTNKLNNLTPSCLILIIQCQIHIMSRICAKCHELCIKAIEVQWIKLCITNVDKVQWIFKVLKSSVKVLSAKRAEKNSHLNVNFHQKLTRKYWKRYNNEFAGMFCLDPENVTNSAKLIGWEFCFFLLHV